MKGRKGQSLRDEAKQWAERMGYRWAENTDASVPFNGFLYRDAVITAVKLKKLRYGLSDDCAVEKKLPEDVADLRNLPVPQRILRELWVRTQNERAYRRFLITREATAEIQEITRDGYRNTHYRERYWNNAPYQVEIPLYTNDSEKRVCQKTP